MDTNTRELFEGWKLNNPIAYLEEEIESLKIARESASTPEEIRYIDRQINDIRAQIRELQK